MKLQKQMRAAVAIVALLCCWQALAAGGVPFVFGNARFTVHTPRLLRLEWSPQAQFENRPSLTIGNRAASANYNTTISPDKKSLTLTTSALTLHYQGSDRFAVGNLAISFRNGPQAVSWRPFDAGQQLCDNPGHQSRRDCGARDQQSCQAMGCCWKPANRTFEEVDIAPCFRATPQSPRNLRGSVETTDWSAPALLIVADSTVSQLRECCRVRALVHAFDGARTRQPRWLGAGGRRRQRAAGHQ